MGNCSKKQNSESPQKKFKPQNTKDFVLIDPSESPKGNTEIMAISKENILKYYKFEKFLGSGGFGTVRSARLKQNPSKVFAVKSINQSKISGKEYLLARELTILKQLSHPNIIKFYEIYEDQLNFHIVMEFCNGGELLQYIIDHQDKLTEKWIQELMFQLVTAVNYLHEKSICHRDIKPQNVLLEFIPGNSVPLAKLIDFGLSCFHPSDSSYFSSKVGTLLYVAPEILQGQYNESCDIWALGIILFVLLSGEVPYDFNTRDELYNKVKAGKLDWSSTIWKGPSRNFSKDGLDCLHQMLELKPQKRITAKQLLGHSWFQTVQQESPIAKDSNLIKTIFEKMLANHVQPSKFRQEVLKLMVNEFTSKEIQSLVKVFQKIDSAKTGEISFKALRDALNNLGMKDMSESKVLNIINQMNQEQIEGISPHSRRINYTEFIARCLDIKEQISEIKLHNIFKEFSQGKSYFTKEDMTAFLARKGKKLSQEVVSQMMHEVDSNQDEMVNFFEFLKLMKTEYQDYSNKHSQRKAENLSKNFSECINEQLQEQKEKHVIQLKPINEISEEENLKK